MCFVRCVILGKFGVLLRVAVVGAVVLLTRPVAMAGPRRDGRLENTGGGTLRRLLLLPSTCSANLRGELPVYADRARCGLLATKEGFAAGRGGGSMVRCGCGMPASCPLLGTWRGADTDALFESSLEDTADAIDEIGGTGLSSFLIAGMVDVVVAAKCTCLGAD
jgi:hypothetical protein